MRPGSPAAKIGFASIDARHAGRRTGKPHGAFAPRTVPVPPPRDYVAADFEDSAVGDKPSSQIVVVSEEDEKPGGAPLGKLPFKP